MLPNTGYSEIFKIFETLEFEGLDQLGNTL